MLNLPLTDYVLYCHDVKLLLHEQLKIENLLSPHINMSLVSYLEQSGMADEGTWGTDIEIFTACSLLSTDIYVYTKVGQRFQVAKVFQYNVEWKTTKLQLCHLFTAN